MSQDQRFIRQRDIVPADRLCQCHIAIIGVGAIGRQVALQLVAMGAPYLQLIDFDTVETVNLAPQGFLETDLGKPKVEATAQQCRRINSDAEIVECCQRFRRSDSLGDVAFLCVDTIATRDMIWQAVRDRIRFLADGRMSAETIRVLAAGDARGRQHYPTTLFAPEEAQVGACTAKSTIFTANIAAGLMVEQFTRWLRGMPTDADITLNLLASELISLPA